VIHPIRFSEYPIKNIYLDLFNVYEVSTIYRCELIKNGILPEFLQDLSQDDWTRGIYMVTEVKNDQNLSLKNPGNLTVTFYRSDGLTQLGAIALEGVSDKTGKIGIIEPVHAYNLISSSFNTDFDVYLSTAIQFLYKSKAL